MLDQPVVAIDPDVLRSRAETCLAGGDFIAADAAYAGVRRTGGLSRTDAGSWLAAAHAFGSDQHQPTRSELVASFPDDPVASTDPYDTAYAEAALWAGNQWGTPVFEGADRRPYKESLREAMTVTDAVGEHILARVIQAESEFEAALAMA